MNKKKVVFDPANAQPSSKKFLKEKRHTFIGMCSIFTQFSMQILNLLCHR